MDRVAALYAQHKQLSVIAAKMYKAGVMVDEAERRRLSNTLARTYNEHVRTLKELVEIRGWRCTPNDLRALIFKKHETPKLKRFSLPDPYNPKLYTSGGLIKVDERALMQLSIHPETPPELCRIIDIYQEAQTARKSRSTFVRSDLVQHAIGRDGRLRPGWNSCGTDTGRWSCSSPNLQTLPRELRSMYVAPTGRVLVHADKSQLELRIMAAVSGDQVLQSNLNTGNVYLAAAKVMFNLPPHLEKCECQGPCVTPTTHLKSSVYKQQKVLQLASQYGAGTPQVHSQRLQGDRNANYADTRRLHGEWMRMYEATVTYWSEEMKRVQATGYSESRIMHRRRVYPAEPPITEAVNYPVQTTAADVMNKILIELDARLSADLPTALITMQQHDDIGAEVDENQAFYACRIFDEVVGQPAWIEGREYDLPVTVKCGVRWSQV